jgi:hypothetical protein
MASARPDKAATELLRQSLAHDPAAGACPGPEILAAYFERSLNADERARWDLHFSGCARCRDELALMEHAGKDAAIGQESPRAAGSRAWLWDWRWLAPAAAVLIIAAIWIVQRPSSPRSESQQPLVAMSQPQVPPMNELSRPSAVPASRIAQNRALDKTQNGPSRELARPSVNEKRTDVAPLDIRRDADSNLPAKSAGAPGKASEGRAAPNNTESKAVAGALQSAPASPAAAAPLAQEANAVGDMAHAETDAAGQALKSKQMAAAAKPNLYAKKDEKAAAATDEIGAAAQVVRTADPKVLWQIPEQGLLKSEDGGATWHGANLPVAKAHVAAIAAPSAKICWLVGRDGLILLTIDGTHWQTITPPTPGNFVRVAAENASSATVVTAEGLRFQTSDGGKHWNPIP